MMGRRQFLRTAASASVGAYLAGCATLRPRITFVDESYSLSVRDVIDVLAVYDVKHVPLLLDEKGGPMYGLTQHMKDDGKNLITISDAFHPWDINDTVVHEVIHAKTRLHGKRMDERLVRLAAEIVTARIYCSLPERQPGALDLTLRDMVDVLRTHGVEHVPYMGDYTGLACPSDRILYIDSGRKISEVKRTAIHESLHVLEELDGRDADHAEIYKRADELYKELYGEPA